MNQQNKIQITTGGNAVLTYSIYYWDYATYHQPVKTLLYVGKAYNFNNAGSIDVYINDIIKNIPRTACNYTIITSNSYFLNTNTIVNISYDVAETSYTGSMYQIYMDNTKYYITGSNLIAELAQPGTMLLLPPTFNKLNKFENNTNTQIAVHVSGSFDNDEKIWGLKFEYTDGTNATELFASTDLISRTTMLITFKQNYLYSINPQPTKTVKSIYLIYDYTDINEQQAVKMVDYLNEPCQYNILSYEGRNGSINYLPLKGNTIYSESIERYKKIDLFDKETIYSTLVDETITINTGWLTDTEAKGLEDVFVSKRIYLFDATLGKYLAVNVEDSSYTQRLYKNERQLKNYTITLKLQQKELV